VSPTRLIFACALAVAALAAAGCGGKIDVPKQDTAMHRGAVLFNERCSGCHTLASANARGSKPEGQAAAGERTNGPNFNIRKENRDDVLFAIRNGGFSGAIMPANVVVGKDAEDVALFVERYAGKKAPPANQSTQKTSQGGQ
jgi:mono/diheme cytochrome c family protein